MKLRKGQKRIKMPPFGLMDAVHLETKEGIAHMRHVPYEVAIGGKYEEGTPTMWAVADRLLIVRPTPDKATDLYVRFFGPLQEV